MLQAALLFKAGSMTHKITEQVMKETIEQVDKNFAQVKEIMTAQTRDAENIEASHNLNLLTFL